MIRIQSLNDLEQQLHYHFSLLRLPQKNWPVTYTHHNETVYDVVIVGAGMSGTCAAAALKLRGIHNILLLDSAPPHQEGPWTNFARMQTLRSPKELTGPALGIPMLTFQAWYTAQHGTDSWHKLDRIPRLVWHDYLQWYKQVLRLPVQNNQRLCSIEPEPHAHLKHPLAKLHVLDLPSQKNQYYYARHVVLALGMDGFGGPNIPDWAQHLPQSLWHHSSEAIDPKTFAKQHVLVIGGGDSALDAVATALENGAQQVDLGIRGSAYTHINYSKALGHFGHRAGYASLSPEQKSTLLSFLAQHATPPSRGTVARVVAAANQRPGSLNLYFDYDVQQATHHQSTISLTGIQHGQLRTLTAERLILATGYQTDPRRRPELHQLIPHLKFYEAHALAPNVPSQSGVFPQLNQDFSFQAHAHTDYPLLAQIHCFMHAAILSVGRICGDIPGISHGAQQMAHGIAAKLYKVDFKHAFNTVQHYDEYEVSDADLHPLMALAKPHSELMS